MQDQLTVSSSVMPSCAQHSRHHHRRTPNHHPAAAAAPVGVGATSGSKAFGPSVGCGGCGYGAAAAACMCAP